MQKIKIIKYSDVISVVEAPYDEAKYKNKSKYLSNNFVEGENGYKLILLKAATDAIADHIQWGNMRIPENRVEQGGVLIGFHYYDKIQDIYFTEAVTAVPAYLAEGSRTFLNISDFAWIDVYNKIDEYNQNQEITCGIVGWYHTHPNDLEVFMSSTDRETQEAQFYKELNYALVFNPHSKNWKSYRGKDSVSCQAVILADGLSAFNQHLVLNDLFPD